MNMMDQFVEEYGEELAEEIFLVFYGDMTSDRVSVHSIFKHDMINKSFMATIYNENGDEICEVSCRDGNWNGSEILKYGDIDIPKRYRTIYYLDISDRIKSDERKLKTAKIIFDHWKEQDWFKKLESDINYDFHFEPTSKINKHYKEIAENKGLQIDSRQIEVEDY